MTAHVKVSNQWREAKSIHYRQGGVWREVADGFVRVNGGWRSFYANEIIYINTTNRAGANIHQLMGSPTKAANYVFINQAGIGGPYHDYALRTGWFPSGSTLRIINEGNIHGRAGLPGTTGNGGAGGTALHLDFPATVENGSGTIWGGGGGGGVGGQGGQGHYHVNNRDPSTGWHYHQDNYEWRFQTGWNYIFWGGIEQTPRFGEVDIYSRTVGALTYHRGPLETDLPYIQRHGIARTWTTTTFTTGGSGGQGGWGAGHDHAQTAGSEGSAGGQGAGWGNWGGSGGDWGQPGAAGARGADGSYRPGHNGGRGGAAGYAINKGPHALNIVSGTDSYRLKGGIV